MPRDAFVAAPSLQLVRRAAFRRFAAEGASFKGATIIARTVPRAPVPRELERSSSGYKDVRASVTRSPSLKRGANVRAEYF
jgi:hypothetical protein